MKRGYLLKRAKELKADGKWDYQNLLRQSDGQEIIEMLREYHLRKDGSKGNCIHGASKLGIQLPMKSLPGQQQLFSQFEKMHGNGYISPASVKENYKIIYRDAKRLFGSYQKAMDSWKNGSYRESAMRIHQGVYTENENKASLRVRLEKIADGDDLSRSYLRSQHPEVFNIIKRLALRKGVSYRRFMAGLGLSAVSSVSSGEKNKEGEIGEMFSMIYLYSLHANGEIVNFWPSSNVNKKITLRKSSEEVIYPDFIVQNKQQNYCEIIEVKSGYNTFTNADLTHAIDKYFASKLDSKELPLALKKLKFTTFHLHFPLDHLATGVKAKINEKGITVVGPNEVLASLHSFSPIVGQEIADLYKDFVEFPIRFVRSKGGSKRAVLEERIKMLDAKHSPLPF